MCSSTKNVPSASMATIKTMQQHLFMPCGRMFGRNCVAKMIKGSTGDLCPICRTSLFHLPPSQLFGCYVMNIAVFIGFCIALGWFCTAVFSFIVRICQSIYQLGLLICASLWRLVAYVSPFAHMSVVSALNQLSFSSITWRISRGMYIFGSIKRLRDGSFTTAEVGRLAYAELYPLEGVQGGVTVPVLVEPNCLFDCSCT